MRIRADGNTYETFLGDTLKTSYDAAVAACMAPAASAAPVIEVTLPPDLTSAGPSAAPAPAGSPAPAPVATPSG